MQCPNAQFYTAAQNSTRIPSPCMTVRRTSHCPHRTLWNQFTVPHLQHAIYLINETNLSTSASAPCETRTQPSQYKRCPQTFQGNHRTHARLMLTLSKICIKRTRSLFYKQDQSNPKLRDFRGAHQTCACISRSHGSCCTFGSASPSGRTGSPRSRSHRPTSRQPRPNLKRTWDP